MSQIIHVILLLVFYSDFIIQLPQHIEDISVLPIFTDAFVNSINGNLHNQLSLHSYTCR